MGNGNIAGGAGVAVERWGSRGKQRLRLLFSGELKERRLAVEARMGVGRGSGVVGRLGTQGHGGHRTARYEQRARSQMVDSCAKTPVTFDHGNWNKQDLGWEARRWDGSVTRNWEAAKKGWLGSWLVAESSHAARKKDQGQHHTHTGVCSVVPA